MPYPSSDLYPSSGGLYPGSGLAAPGAFIEGSSSTLNEDYNDDAGRLSYYDSYDSVARAALRQSKHVDIRVFDQNGHTVASNLLELSAELMSELNGDPVNVLDSTIVYPGESWTVGTVGEQADRNNMLGITYAISGAGTWNLDSIVEDHPANILDEFDDNDILSVSLPAWPGTANISSCTLSLTSGSSFATGPTASVNMLTEGLYSLTASGDKEFRVYRSAVNESGLDLSRITGVRFTFVTTAAVTVRIMSVRLLHKSWSFTKHDVDTRREIYRQTVPLNGALAGPPYAYTQPIFWRSAEVPGENDPRPVNWEVAAQFHTGQRTVLNTVAVYGRELTEDFLTQLDLNGLTMAEFNGRVQPDVGTARWTPRLQSDLDGFTMDQIDGLRQWDLERTPDLFSASWIKFELRWNGASTQLEIENTEGGGFTNLSLPSLSANTDYILLVRLEDTAVRARVYTVGPRGQLETLIYDTTIIDNDFDYKRRQGRFGWYADLGDGDAYVESLRFRSITYSEYRSFPYRSLTPVAGAELFAEYSPDIHLFAGFSGTNSNTVLVSRDTNRSTTGESWRIDDYGIMNNQGVISNRFEITDFEQTEIVLDLYYPGSAFVPIVFHLKNVKFEYYFAMPAVHIVPEQWQTIRLRPPAINGAYPSQTGTHQLLILQTAQSATTWWVDNVNIYERQVSWYARSAIGDPWGTTPNAWTPYKSALNKEYGGVWFASAGKNLQLRALGHRAKASLGRIEHRPRYAQLGRLIPNG